MGCGRVVRLADRGARAGTRRRLALGLTGLVLVLVPVVAAAHSFAGKSFRQLVTEADHVFLGTVTAITPERLPSGVIVSHVSLVDVSAVKGGHPPSVVTVLGGTIDGQGMRVAGIPEFQLHQRYLLFERGNGRDAYPFVGGTNGVFKVGPHGHGHAAVSDAFGLQILVDRRFDPSLTAEVPLTLEMLLRAIRDVSPPGS